MTDVSTRTRIGRLFGGEKIPILDHAGDFNYTDPAALKEYLTDARLGSFSKWAAAKARGASAPARCIFDGDSNVMGQGANSGTTLFTKGFARDFADQMGWLSGSIIGSQGRASDTIANFKTYNPTVATTGNWAVDTGAKSLGANMFKMAASGSTGNFTWTPTQSFNKLRLWYPQNTGLLTALTVTIDGVLVDTINTAGASSLQYKDYALGSLTTHTVVISRGNTSADGYVVGMEIWDTTNGTPVYLQAGWWGSSIANHVNTAFPWEALPALGTLAPDLAFMYCTINDLTAATALQTYYKNFEIWVKKAKLSADVVLFFGYPADVNGQLNGTGDSMARALKNIAEDYDCSYLDFRKLLGHSYARANDLGYAFDNAHPTQAGHDAMADLLYAFIGDQL